MRLAQIYQLLSHEPLLMANDYRATLLQLLEDHRTLDRASYIGSRTGKRRSGEDADVPQATVRDGVAIIPVMGPMGVGLGEFEKGAGATDTTDVENELDEAEADDAITAAILNIDSPGGMYAGTFELAARIADFDKPVYAWSRGKMCSAAYAIAAATDGIFGSVSCVAGNIGVYTTLLDTSGLLAAAGARVKVFASGPIKGLGVPGAPLTAEQEVFMQQHIGDMAKVFFEHIRAQRPQIGAEDLGGQFYAGQVAVDRGFLDGLMRDLGELEAFLRG